MNPTLQSVERTGFATDAESRDAVHPEILSLLLRRVPAGSRVAVVGSSDALAQRLASAGCNVQASSGTDDPEAVSSELRRFGPHRVLLAGDWVRAADPAALIAAIVRAAPAAEVVAAFRNASGAGVVTAAVCGGTSSPAIAEEQVQTAFRSAGLAPLSRESVREAGSPLGAPVPRALRSILEQLNPSAAADWIVLVGARAVDSAAQAVPSIVPGLLSVVIRNHSTSRMALLDHTVFSLACQAYRPLEIVFATQSREDNAVEAFTRLLERHQPVGEYDFRVLSLPSEEDIRGRLLNEGVRHARGQYVAFLDDDDVVYPHHYTRLISAMQGSDAAWAISRTRVARFNVDPSGSLYCSKKSDLTHHETFVLRDFVRVNYVACHAYVLDRQRLGRFEVAFSEKVKRCEDYAFLLRLAAQFRPAFLGGPPSCEYRIRDDGTNSNPLAGMPAHVRAREQVEWAASDVLLDMLRKDLYPLLTYADYAQDTCDSPVDRPGAPPPPLRYRLVDTLNESVKRLAPSSHDRLKRLVGRIIR